MRLTLRTLLAYMDDMLDPADQEELGRKIESSPFATELIHRSRDAVRRLRLSAPEPIVSESGDLHGGDTYLDPNTAAEYLDSTLPPEQVGEFERHCLEAGPNADMLLAEAVSCHHILTLVLGEPAEVDADLRQRMYEIIAHSEPQKLRIEGAHDTPQLEAAPTPMPIPRRPAVDPDEAAVPDYILEAARARRRTRNQLIAMMVVAASLGGLLVYFAWPQRDTTPPVVASGEMGDPNKFEDGVATAGGSTTDAGPEETDPDATQAAIEAGGDAPAFVPGAPTADEGTGTAAPGDDAVTAEGTPPLEGDDATPDLEADDPAPGDLAVELPTPEGVGIDETPTADDSAADDTTADPATGDVAAGTGDETAADDAGAGVGAGVLAPGGTTTGPPVIPPDGGIEIDPGTTVMIPGGDLAGDTGPPPVPPGDATAETGAGDAGADTLPPADATGLDAAPPADATVETTDPATDFAGDAAAPPTAADDAPRQLGAYLGLNDDLLLRMENGGWVRLPPRSALGAGDRLLVLPNFRTLAVLGADVNAFLGGGTELTIVAPEPGEGAADIGFELPYGRVILNAGLNGNRIAIVLGDQTRVVMLGPSSSVAIEATRTFVPGADPATEPAPIAISWYLTSGKAEWNDGTTDHTAEGPAAWTTVDGVDQAPQALDELPEWIDREPMTNVETGARDAVAERLTAGQPVNIALLELTTPTGLGRRTEVRSLAARSGAYVGEFEPLVKALSDPVERARRKEQVETLRTAIARNPEAVEQIHAALELQRGQQAADDLTEMLLGYSSADIGTTKDEVKQGVLVRLINWLNDDDLAYRVLASHNINEITGTSYLGGYRPEHPARQREREMRYYWDRLEKGELMPR